VKILHLVQKPQLRGAEMFAAQLASHIHCNNHEVIMVFVFSGNAQLPFNGKKLSLDGKPWRRWWNVTAWHRLAKIIKEEQPDIIQANAGDTLKYAVFSKLIFRWKQPIVFRNASTISLYIKTSLARLWNAFFFRFANKVIAVCHTSAADFARVFPQFQDRVTTIPVGIEAKDVKAQKRPPIANNERLADPVLIHVGGFTFEKNHIRLLNIFERILEKCPGACLHFVGDGPLKKEVEEIVQHKKLTTRTRFYGFRNDVMQLISEADVLLLPSVIEGLPGVILEAFYCKTPVVAYNVGGVGEVLINDETGRLVKKGDENAFVNATLAAIVNTTHNRKLVENAHQIVTSGYLNERIAKRFIQLYELITWQNRSAYYNKKTYLNG
jgi:glycosyltransferase involved in cell wall biosynthesis